MTSGLGREITMGANVADDSSACQLFPVAAEQKKPSDCQSRFGENAAQQRICLNDIKGLLTELLP
jgi:hypothetical protein